MSDSRSIRFAWEHALRDPDQRPAALTSTDIAVALMIATWAFTPWEVSQAELAAATGFSRRAVGESTRRLVATGVLTTTRSGLRSPLRYQLVDPAEWGTTFPAVGNHVPSSGEPRSHPPRPTDLQRPPPPTPPVIGTRSRPTSQTEVGEESRSLDN